jgi:hypothetical protein
MVNKESNGNLLLYYREGIALYNVQYMYNSVYVPLPYITYLIDSGPFSKSLEFFSWAGHKAVHKVISPSTYVPHDGPAFPEKSAKILICQKSKLSVCSSSAFDESLMRRWTRFKIVGSWSQWDIKLPMYRWFWKFEILFFVLGLISLWAISHEGQHRGQKSLGPSKYSLKWPVK